MDPSPFLLWFRSYHPSKPKSPINGLWSCLSLCQLPPFPPHGQKRSLYPLEFLFLSLCLQAFVSFSHNVLEKRTRCSQLVLCLKHKEPKSVTSLSSHGNRMWCHTWKVMWKRPGKDAFLPYPQWVYVQRGLEKMSCQINFVKILFLSCSNMVILPSSSTLGLKGAIGKCHWIEKCSWLNSLCWSPILLEHRGSGLCFSLKKNEK